MNQLVDIIIQLLVGGLICWLLWWLIGFCNVPEPFNKIARVVIAVFAVLVVINILLSVSGHPIVNWRRTP